MDSVCSVSDKMREEFVDRSQCLWLLIYSHKTYTHTYTDRHACMKVHITVFPQSEILVNETAAAFELKCNNSDKPRT